MFGDWLEVRGKQVLNIGSKEAGRLVEDFESLLTRTQRDMR